MKIRRYGGNNSGRLADNRYINTDNIVEGDILYNLESTGLHIMATVW